MQARVVVCNGCCCGRVEKGHNEVPVDSLEKAWDEHGLGRSVKLIVSDCLGPCSMHNVSLLNTERGKTWLGKLSAREHYEALVGWALEFSQHGVEGELPEILTPHLFEPKDESD